MPGASVARPAMLICWAFFFHLLSSYCIATAPDRSSSRSTSLRPTGFDSPANNVGPWPASLGCTTNSYSSINPISVNACARCRFPRCRRAPRLLHHFVSHATEDDGRLLLGLEDDQRTVVSRA